VPAQDGDIAEDISRTSSPRMFPLHQLARIVPARLGCVLLLLSVCNSLARI
jgi:hypothetical protein